MRVPSHLWPPCSVVAPWLPCRAHPQRAWGRAAGTVWVLGEKRCAPLPPSPLVVPAVAFPGIVPRFFLQKSSLSLWGIRGFPWALVLFLSLQALARAAALCCLCSELPVLLRGDGGVPWMPPPTAFGSSRVPSGWVLWALIVPSLAGTALQCCPCTLWDFERARGRGQRGPGLQHVCTPCQHGPGCFPPAVSSPLPATTERATKSSRGGVPLFSVLQKTAPRYAGFLPKLEQSSFCSTELLHLLPAAAVPSPAMGRAARCQLLSWGWGMGSASPRLKWRKQGSASPRAPKEKQIVLTVPMAQTSQRSGPGGAGLQKGEELQSPAPQKGLALCNRGKRTRK